MCCKNQLSAQFVKKHLKKSCLHICDKTFEKSQLNVLFVVNNLKKRQLNELFVVKHLKKNQQYYLILMKS